MKVSMRVEGFKELESALLDMSRATARNVAIRALRRAAEPVREQAERLAPVRQGNLALSIVASPRAKNSVGKAEYAAAMAGGLGKDAAVSAMRAARRSAKGSSSIVEVHVGPRTGVGVIRYAHLIEFGSSQMPAQPYMRPAWDGQKDNALGRLRDDLATEIKKAVARAERRAARAAAKSALKA